MCDPVLKFLTAVINKDQNVLDQISSTGYQVDFVEGSLVFDLAGIYGLTTDSEVESYTQFRSKLYSGRINTQLAAQGYKVVVWKSTGKIDNNVYQLVEVGEES